MTRPGRYAALAAVVENLPWLVTDARRRHGLSLREAGDEIGVSFTAIRKLEHGGGGTRPTIVAVLLWLDRRDQTGG